MRTDRSRREFMKCAGASGSMMLMRKPALALLGDDPEPPLEEFGYGQVSIRGAIQQAQRDNVRQVLMSLDEDSLLKPFREMSGVEAPGNSLGGWYEWKPDYNYHHDDAGLAPGSTFGQWTSALCRLHASSRSEDPRGQAAVAARVMRLHRALVETITSGYFEKTRFPGYSYDKLVCGVMDAHRLIGDPDAFAQLDKITDVALPSLPGRAIPRDVQWKPGADLSWMWDETYTMPENLYLVFQMRAGMRYRAMAQAYLMDESFFEPLSRGVNALVDKHACSHVNALCSAMQAYLVAGSGMHLAAALQGFDFLEQQSFATGGWGPDELLRKPGYDELAKSLTLTHNGFETPCGSYMQMKLTRYLLRATRDGRYGDSMERVMLNTIMGALPLEADGRSFYNCDYNNAGKRVYSVHRWPCCSGTLPQVVADYGINGYFHEPSGVWVNLYQPSELRWRDGESLITLEQEGTYLQDGTVRMKITASRPSAFTLHLRVPAWAAGRARLRVNDRPEVVAAWKGFTAVRRVWRTGDRVELMLPMSLRLELLPADGATVHTQTAALLWGPLVLFPVREGSDKGPMTFTRENLLGAKRSDLEWTATSSSGARKLVPFFALGDSEYSTYVHLTG